MIFLFYITLVILSPISWSWIWAMVALAASFLEHYFYKRQFGKLVPLAYMQGLKYMEHRYSLPSARLLRPDSEFEEKEDADEDDEDETAILEEHLHRQYISQVSDKDYKRMYLIDFIAESEADRDK